MSDFADLVLNDGVASRTFTRSSIDQKGVARWFRAMATFGARHAASLSVRLPVKGGSVARTVFRVVIPVMDTTDTSKKVGECVLNVEAIIPVQSTVAERSALRVLGYNALGHTVLTDAIENLNAVY